MSTPSTPSTQVQEEKTLLKQVQFIKALTADPHLTADGKAVANALIFVFWNKGEGKARPGHTKLATIAGTNVSAVKKGIKSLQKRGWFTVEPAWDENGDPAANHYYPIWRRAEGKAPVGSERPKKAPRNPDNKITFQAGAIRLTASEVADIEEKVGVYAMPFFDGLRHDALDWPKETWRAKLADRVATYAEDEEVTEPADEEEMVF